MTNQHRATPDDWAQQEDWANRSVFSYSSCIIELRDRLEALEVLIHELQTMHNTAVDWRMEQDHRLNQLKATQHAHAGAPFPVTPPNCRQRLLRDGKPYPKSSCEACGSLSPMWRQCNAALVALEPTTQPPAGSLVERIKRRLIKGIGGTWEETSCDVIREVAAWLKEKGYSTLQAEALTREANR
jgi:hypothetical protein